MKIYTYYIADFTNVRTVAYASMYSAEYINAVPEQLYTWKEYNHTFLIKPKDSNDE